MTEEDQKLVAHAALMGVRFWRATRDGDQYWYNSVTPDSGMFTMGRAAAKALCDLGLMPHDEYLEYERRTDRGLHDPRDDIDLSALAGCQPPQPAEEPQK